MTGVLQQIGCSGSGLPKRAIAGPAMLSASGVAGDWQRDLRYHGGPDNTSLALAELVDDLAARGYTVVYGAMGENLTVSGLDPHLWRAGQRYRIGEDAVIELTTLRTPCSNLLPYGATIGAELYDAQCSAGDVLRALGARRVLRARHRTQATTDSGCADNIRIRLSLMYHWASWPAGPDADDGSVGRIP